MNTQIIAAILLALAALAAGALLFSGTGSEEHGDDSGGEQTPETFEIRIDYVYEDGTEAAESYSALLSAGDSYSVSSPVTEGYGADRNVVSGTVSGSEVITVTYSALRYEVVWKDSGGTVLEIDADVPYGTVPSYDGDIPSGDGRSFSGWSPAVSAVTGNTVYTAVYSAVPDLSDLEIELVSGTAGCYALTEDPSSGELVLAFGEISEDTEYSLSGTLYGSIIVNAGDDFAFTLDLNGVTIESSANVPLYVSSAEEFDLSVKKGTENFIRDLRPAAGDDGISAAIYCVCDMDLKGKGTLSVVSASNNGIHSK
ncbi:MAG: carbohydrate-binding domain-containing protein, partial [Candidatus Methanomethylophilaceae archaeon]|nr:carbohydrate-binding domain-containing protein [Candidatus Methanomethylophilaceae archaeon]